MSSPSKTVSPDFTSLDFVISTIVVSVGSLSSPFATATFDITPVAPASTVTLKDNTIVFPASTFQTKPVTVPSSSLTSSAPLSADADT